MKDKTMKKTIRVFLLATLFLSNDINAKNCSQYKHKSQQIACFVSALSPLEIGLLYWLYKGSRRLISDLKITKGAVITDPLTRLAYVNIDKLQNDPSFTDLGNLLKFYYPNRKRIVLRRGKLKSIYNKISNSIEQSKIKLVEVLNNSKFSTKQEIQILKNDGYFSKDGTIYRIDSRGNIKIINAMSNKKIKAKLLENPLKGALPSDIFLPVGPNKLAFDAAKAKIINSVERNMLYRGDKKTLYVKVKSADGSLETTMKFQRIDDRWKLVDDDVDADTIGNDDLLITRRVSLDQSGFDLGNNSQGFDLNSAIKFNITDEIKGLQDLNIQLSPGDIYTTPSKASQGLYYTLSSTGEPLSITANQISPDMPINMLNEDDTDSGIFDTVGEYGSLDITDELGAVNF